MANRKQMSSSQRQSSREISSPTRAISRLASNGGGSCDNGGSFLTKYFLIILFAFACLSVLLSNNIAHLVADDQSVIEAALKQSTGGVKSSRNEHANRIADLKCDKFGGPSVEAANEMVYWENIPSDATWVSPFHDRHHNGGPQQFLTFEPDQGGWNNIRMAMETVLAMAFAMGRTLVLPPHQQMYLLTNKEKGQRSHFSFEHFFVSCLSDHRGMPCS